jgi:cell wall-associated NlpC family hydrolase
MRRSHSAPLFSFFHRASLLSPNLASNLRNHHHAGSSMDAWKKAVAILAVLFGIESSALCADAASLDLRTTPQPSAMVLSVAIQIHKTKLDCSHLVHDLYERAGLAYEYQNSRTLYRGIEEFTRVGEPEPGDLIVWQGHVGIVVNSKQQIFISALRSRVKLSSYESQYWKRRGTPRFYRYALHRSTQPAQEDTAQVAIAGLH